MPTDEPTEQLYMASGGEVDGPHEGICRNKDDGIYYLPKLGVSGCLGAILFLTKDEAISEASMQIARLQKLLDDKKHALNALR